jgi:predicted nucleic acid-binding protein
MTSTAGRANCFDASALLKRYVDEDKSDVLRNYWNSESTKFTTSFCFYETLTLLKVHHFYRKSLAQDPYKRATLDLCAWYCAVSTRYPELNFLSPDIFFTAQRTAEKHGLDLSDAFQILSVKNGFFSRLCGDSQTILVTADAKLASAARMEGIRVWSVLDEPAP